MIDTKIIQAVSKDGGVTGGELAAIALDYEDQLQELVRAGLPIQKGKDGEGKTRYSIGATPKDEEERAPIAPEASSPQAPPAIASPAEAPATPRPEIPPAYAPPDREQVVRRIRVTDFRVSAGGGRTKITATPADVASAGTALELSGMETGVLVLHIFVEGETPQPTEAQPVKKERSAKEIAAEIVEQEKGGQIPGVLAAAMGNLIGRG